MAVRDRTDDTRSHHTHRRRKKKIHNWRIRISSGYETGSTVARVCSVCELRISQPAISKHIAELKHALGLELVERARRDGALTSAGDFVANHVLRAESLLVRAGLGVAQFRKSGSGSVAVVASSLTGSYFTASVKCIQCARSSCSCCLLRSSFEIYGICWLVVSDGSCIMSKTAE